VFVNTLTSKKLHVCENLRCTSAYFLSYNRRYTDVETTPSRYSQCAKCSC